MIERLKPVEATNGKTLLCPELLILESHHTSSETVAVAASLLQHVPCEQKIQIPEQHFA